MLPPIDYLEECFDYHPSGILIWKERPRTHFQTTKRRDQWNRKFAGKDAGSLASSYVLQVSFNQQTYSVAKIVWKLHTNEEPETIYYQNGIKADTRIENLTDGPGANLNYQRYVPGTPICLTEYVLPYTVPQHNYFMPTLIFAVLAGALTFRYFTNIQQATDFAIDMSEKLGVSYYTDL